MCLVSNMMCIMLSIIFIEVGDGVKLYQCALQSSLILMKRSQH